MIQRWKIEVRGIVQGVGFRPFVYRLACQHGLSGYVSNSESGVLIEAEGEELTLATFVAALRIESPAAAQVTGLTTTTTPVQHDRIFAIQASTRSGSADTMISPDIATCSGCVAELFDPANRRYLYPFINCTNCGPRFTITHSVPYDRAQTSMAAFTMCPQCQAEFDDPANRRFHAQPNACSQCGPHLQLLDCDGGLLAGDPITETIRLLRQGRIVAIKGLGGFHLAVDARNSEAVAELRWRKHRGQKPFAMMVANTAALDGVCDVSAQEQKLLESPQRPIVLLRKSTTAYDALAPDGDRLGVFLPYTPIHHLLATGVSVSPLVMTSANITDEPIAIDNEEARTRLNHIADYFLIHNREIRLRCDDSVMRLVAGRPQFARRSRGFVPAPIMLRRAPPSILAVGGELKNTVCLSRGAAAFLGQHIGDVETLTAYGFFQESIAHLQKILEVQPGIIAHDLHPGYLSTQWAMRQREEHPGIQLVGIQHHHAHIASCMAEHQLEEPVIGIALDGTGYGIDAEAWGGEVFIGDLRRFDRVAHFAYVPLPGGAKAIHEPWRMALAYLRQTFGEDWRAHVPDPLLAKFPATPSKHLEQLLHRGTHFARTSSCGRLFDAVAVLVLGRTHVTYEAQAAIALEACCDTRDGLGTYPFEICEGQCLQIHSAPFFSELTCDLHDSVPASIISRRFHNGLADVLSDVARRIASRTGLKSVCLSGGCMQNAVLSQGLQRRLTHAGMNVYIQTKVPPGDGGLSLGQLAIAACVVSQ